MKMQLFLFPESKVIVTLRYHYLIDLGLTVHIELCQNFNTESMEERLLSPEEIRQLEQQGCHCSSWSQIFVSTRFSPANIHNTTFSGEVHLGVYDETLQLTGNMPVKTGIYNAVIHQSIIGNNCYIKNIQGYIANYHIGHRTIIHNCGIIVATEKTTYGQGTMISAVNEAGGRELPIYDTMSSNMAHILTHYRYKPRLIERLTALINLYTQHKIAKFGRIGMRVTITNCQSIENVHIDSHAVLTEVTKLFNGTINSSQQFPTRIGAGVIAKHFIIGAGSKISNGAHIKKCFIGQACLVSHHFSAENSLIFANSELLNGEGLSIMAGPFTVSHHKTSLLIASAHSFFNAGSGTNQSNHHYKLGPTHQAIMDRGVKTASNSYILEPAHIGAFTMIAGSHRHHPDTSMFPFSYLIEREKESILLIGQNMKTIGMFRDEKKWFQRDHRPIDGRLDRLEVSPLNPVTVTQMLAAIQFLKQQTIEPGMLEHNGVFIHSERIPQYVQIYTKAIKDFLYEQLFLEIEKPTSHKWISNNTITEWADIGGMIAPQWRISSLISRVERDQYHSITDVENELSSIFEEYGNDKRGWSLHILKSHFSITPQLSPTDFLPLAEEWLAIQEESLSMLLKDAMKEFSHSLSVGYGMDGEPDDHLADFSIIKGKAEEHNAIKQCHRHFEQRINWIRSFIKKYEPVTE